MPTYKYEGIVEVTSFEKNVGNCGLVNDYLRRGWVLLDLTVTYDGTRGRTMRDSMIVYVLGRKADAEESE